MPEKHLLAAAFQVQPDLRLSLALWLWEMHMNDPAVALGPETKVLNAPPDPPSPKWSNSPTRVSSAFTSLAPVLTTKACAAASAAGSQLCSMTDSHWWRHFASWHLAQSGHAL